MQGYSALISIVLYLNVVVTVKFVEPVYNVNEDMGPAQVCMEKDKDIAESFTVTLTPQDRTAGKDNQSAQCMDL